MGPAGHEQPQCGQACHTWLNPICLNVNSMTIALLLKRTLAIRSTLLALLLPALLLGCGGQNDESSTSDDVKYDVAATSQSSSVINGQNYAITITKTFEERVSRTVFEYEFSVEVLGQGTTALPRGLRATTDQPGSELLTDSVFFANNEPLAKSKIRLRHDRARPFDANVWSWSEVKFLAETGQSDLGAPDGLISVDWAGPLFAAIGSIAERRIKISTAEAITVTQLEVSNATAFGAAPVLQNSFLSWAPNAGDLNTTDLKLDVTLSNGVVVKVALPVIAFVEEAIARIDVVDGRDVYSDSTGAVVMRVSGSIPSGAWIDLKRSRDGQGRLSFGATPSSTDIVVTFVEAPRWTTSSGAGTVRATSKPSRFASSSPKGASQAMLSDRTEELFGPTFRNGSLLARQRSGPPAQTQSHTRSSMAQVSPGAQHIHQKPFRLMARAHRNRRAQRLEIPSF